MDIEFPHKWIDLKFGGKVSFTTANSEIALYNTTDGESVLDSSQSDSFQYKERTQALYISGNKTISNKIEGQVGIRMENTQTNGYSFTLSQKNKKNYLKLFPTLYLLYKPDSLNVFSINYNRRINRPSYSYLNPFRWYSTSISYTEGNPFLQPSFSQNIELSYTYKGNFNNKVYFSSLTDGFNQITVIEADTDTQRIVPWNYIKSYSIGFTSSYIFDKIKWWSSSNTIYLSYNSARATVEITNQKLSGSSLYFSTSNDFILDRKRTVIANINYWYNTSGVYGLDTFSSYNQLDVALRILLLQKNLQIAFACNDIFKSSITTITSYSNNIRQEYINYYDSRLLRISVTYKFGGRKTNINKNPFSNADEQNRIK